MILRYFVRVNVDNLRVSSKRLYAGIHQRAPVIKLPTQRLNDLKSRLCEDPLPSAAEWGNIRKSILDERRFTAANVDSTVLGLCGSLECGKSYVAFLRSKGYTLNLATMGRLLRLYRVQSNDAQLQEKELEEILTIHAELKQNNSMLDSTTCANLIGALTLTDKWRNSFELLDMIKLTGTPDSATYNFLVQKCFLSEDAETAWNLLEEQTANNRIPNEDVYLAWISSSLSKKRNIISEIVRMLSFTSSKSLFLPKRVATVLKQLPPESGISAFDTRITDYGKCSHCKSTIASIAVPEASFLALRDAFVQAVIVKKEIFNNTTPEELQRFQRFVKQTKPYDIVIDGLNVALSTGNQKSPNIYAMQIAAVVRHYVQRKKRVLVIGRQHMNRWRSKDMKYIREKAYLFLTEDLSQDDPFLLYAALESGSHTDFFSRDLMRKHSFQLGNGLGTVFKKWQQQHQYSLLTITPEGRVLVKSPFQYELYAHPLPDNPKVWHVPLVEDCLKIAKIEKQPEWLCLKLS
ncbi:mitochondrial ribonuclease P catalytic subunit [Wyeomyia smithii]|uniref:mitochondrial ribonuclease P catalytic subunit n=1 Tax=Wyeomyia smithii TaxID=174621 RepID=UPI002467C180|nr:mitochondrial ribonuclease P catalytic subunit [Wyeomyia smithii]